MALSPPRYLANAALSARPPDNPPLWLAARGSRPRDAAVGTSSATPWSSGGGIRRAHRAGASGSGASGGGIRLGGIRRPGASDPPVGVVARLHTAVPLARFGLFDSACRFGAISAQSRRGMCPCLMVFAIAMTGLVCRRVLLSLGRVWLWLLGVLCVEAVVSSLDVAAVSCRRRVDVAVAHVDVQCRLA